VGPAAGQARELAALERRQTDGARGRHDGSDAQLAVAASSPRERLKRLAERGAWVCLTPRAPQWRVRQVVVSRVDTKMTQRVAPASREQVQVDAAEGVDLDGLEHGAGE
jgi:hypothetical protein